MNQALGQRGRSKKRASDELVSPGGIREREGDVSFFSTRPQSKPCPVFAIVPTRTGYTALESKTLKAIFDHFQQYFLSSFDFAIVNFVIHVNTCQCVSFRTLMSSYREILFF